jgi:hypothetical protein
MEIEMKTEALGSRPDYPMQLVVAQRNMAFTPAEERRREYLGVQGRTVEVRRMVEKDDDEDDEMFRG